jgi:signal transduction histidine kinase
MKNLRHSRHFAHALFAVFFLLFDPYASGQQSEKAAAFHSVSAIRALSLDQLNRGYPASIRGVVTMSDNGLVVHDATEGIWVYWNKPQDYAPGDEVVVQGSIGPGKFAPVVNATSVRKVGTAPLPKPRAVTFDQLSSGTFDVQYVTLTGYIRSVGKHEDNRHLMHLLMRVESGNGTLMVTLPGGNDEAVRYLIDGMVRITATAMCSKNNNRQLIAPILSISEIKDIVLLRPPTTDPWSTPMLPIGRLMQWRSGTNLHHRVHVAGTVTYFRPGESLVVEDRGAALYVRTDDSPNLSLGDHVEAIGFPTPRSVGPILVNAIVRRISAGPELPPTAVRLQDACSGNLNYNLISTEGVLLQQLHGPSQEILLLKDGSNVIEAELGSSAGSTQLRAIQDGSTVRVHGINALEIATAWNYDVVGVEKVRCKILLRSENDAILIQSPTWWTVRHTLYIAIGLAALALLFLIQMIRDVFQRGRLQAVLAERERLANEIHDTLAQSFTGIGFQLQAIRREIPRELGNLHRQVDLARDLVRHSHKEARRTLVSIGSESNERIDLLRQLEESAKKMAEGGAVEISVFNAGDPRPLRPPAATALLRIGQEAIANAIRHAEPIHLRIALSYDMEGVSLSVTDDGMGFIESGDLLGFGLRGMRRRAASVSGVLEISSTLGSGTQIRVFVPSQSAFGFSGIRRSLQRHVWERILHAYSGR